MKRKPHKPRPSCAFPLETFFPGIHAERPDIAAFEAEQFLAHGSGPRGFSLDDPDVRRWLTDPAHQFIDFQVSPLPPEWTALTNTLPDWEHPAASTVADAILADLRVRVPGLRPDLTAYILEEKEVWIYATGKGRTAGP